MRFVSVFLAGALLAKAAVYLEPNRGQADIQAAYLARTSTGTIAAGPSSIGFLRKDGSRESVVLEGASPDALAVPEQPLPGVSHYVRYHDPARWLWDVPHYGAVRYREVYPGIDLLYRGANGDVEFDFILAAGADPSRIRMRVPAGVRIDASGALAFGGTLLKAPVALQTIRGKRVPVTARFQLDKHRLVSFQLGDYDPSLPLTIDPVVQFATFLGGSGSDEAVAVLSGSDGAIYTAGNTTSANFPAALSPENPLNLPEALLQPAAFIARLKPDASALDWSLFIGGSASQSVFGLKQDTLGNLYLLGSTTSPNFPVTANAWHATIDPSVKDLFLVKLDAKTGRLKASTFLWTGSSSTGPVLAVDIAGGVYISGRTLDTGRFTPTPGALQTTPWVPDFVLHLNSEINSVLYATYWSLGPVSAMEVDSARSLVMGGVSSLAPPPFSPPFSPVNPLPGINQHPDWQAQAYLAKLNPAGTALALATLLHGDGRGSGISDLKLALDGTVYVAGWTSGSKFPQVNPLNLDPFPPIPPIYPDDSINASFLVRLAADGKSILQSTLFQPQQYPPLDKYLRLTFQQNGRPCLAGLAMLKAQQSQGGIAGNFPNDSTPSVQGSLTCVDPNGSRVNLRTGLPGGAGYTAVAATYDGGFLFAGSANDSFVATPGTIQPGHSRNKMFESDAFLLRVNFGNPVPDVQRIAPDFIVLDSSISGTCATSLFGSGFAWGAAVTLNGEPVNYTFINAGEAAIAFDCRSVQPGSNRIVMTMPPPGGGTSERMLTGINSPPSGIFVSPTSVNQAAGPTKLVVRAANVTSGSVLYWNGTQRIASFVLDPGLSRGGHFEFLLEPADLAQPGSNQISVTNPGPGGGSSAIALFVVQPASNAVPVITRPAPLFYNALNPLGPQVPFSGSGFTSRTRAFWDGVEISVAAVNANRIDVRPPSGDLNRLGAHDFYVTNDAFRSATVRVYIGHAVTAVGSAYNPVRNLLFAITETPSTISSYDLLVWDAATGNLLTRVPGFIPVFRAVALSADGRYLYVAGVSSTSKSTILRYNTAAGAVDLQWEVPLSAGQSRIDINSLVTPPDSPETVIVSTTMGEVMIFDRDRPRPYTFLATGLPSDYFQTYPLVFAGASRIYTGATFPSQNLGRECWLWLDYDVFGISGGQPSCTTEPSETQHDSGVTYLSDGNRTYVASATSPLRLKLDDPRPNFALDLTRRVLWQFGSSSSGANQLLSYTMDSQQFLLVGQILYPYSLSPAKLYPVGNGTVLLVSPSYVMLLP